MERHFIALACHKHGMDIVGRDCVTLNKTENDTVCMIEYFLNGALTEQYIDKCSRTIY